MTVRDYTQEKYNALVEALENQKNDHQFKAEEVFDDFLMRGAHHLGLYDTESVVASKMERYQANMMDAYNTKISDLTNIFDNVQSIDSDYGSTFRKYITPVSGCKNALQTLRDSFGSINDTASLQSLQSKLEDINKEMNQADAAIAENVNKAIDYEMTYLKHEAAKGMLKSSLSMLDDIFGFCGSVMKGDAAGVTDKLWSLCNDYMDLCSNSDVMLNVGLTTVGGWILSGKGEDSVRRFQQNQLKMGREELEKEDGVAGQAKTLSDNPENNFLYQISRGADTVQDVYSLVDGIKNFSKDFIERKGFLEKMDETINPTIPDSLKDNKHLSKRYETLKRTQSVIKIVKGGASAATSDEPDGWAEFAEGQAESYTHSGSLVSIFNDEVDVLEDIDDFFDERRGD